MKQIIRSMIKDFDIKIDVDTSKAINPFFEIKNEKGTKNVYKDVQNNYLVFVISGSLRVAGKDNTNIELKPNHMYAFCKLCAPYHTEALEDFHCLVLVADSLANHVNAKNLVKILSSNRQECKGIPELRYNIVFESFVSSITLLSGCKENLSSDLYNIKKVEYLHYMRQLYSKEQLAAFMYGIVSTYSVFKRKVYENYDNSVGVEQLADRLFMTPKTFTRHFKQEFDVTPLDWIIEQRIYNLNHCIINRAMPLSNILEDFDFSSYSVLKQFCKRHKIEHLLDFIQEEKAV